MKLSRRGLIITSGGLLLTAFAGCNSPSRTSTPTAETTTEPTEQREIDETLAPRAAVINQPSVDSPATVQLSVENRGSAEEQVRFGPALLFTDDTAENLRWSEEVLIDPTTDVGTWSEPERSTDGCWRFPEDGDRSVISSIDTRTIPAGESLSEEYTVYTSEEASECLPTGEHTYEDILDTRVGRRVLSLRIVIDETARIQSVGGSLSQQ